MPWPEHGIGQLAHTHLGLARIPDLARGVTGVHSDVVIVVTFAGGPCVGAVTPGTIRNDNVSSMGATMNTSSSRP